MFALFLSCLPFSGKKTLFPSCPGIYMPMTAKLQKTKFYHHENWK